MKILFIGGTGNISSTITRMLAASGHEVHLLNRAKTLKHLLPKGAKVIAHDVHGGAPPAALRGAHYDAVVDWIAFTVPHIERDLAWFGGGPEAASTNQFVFISSASAYQKPPVAPGDHRVDAAREPVLGVLAQQDRLRGAR